MLFGVWWDLSKSPVLGFLSNSIPMSLLYVVFLPLTSCILNCTDLVPMCFVTLLVQSYIVVYAFRSSVFVVRFLFEWWYFDMPTGCSDWTSFSDVIRLCHSETNLATSAILTASSSYNLRESLSKKSSMSSSTSCSYSPTSIGVTPLRRARACVILAIFEAIRDNGALEDLRLRRFRRLIFDPDGAPLLACFTL